ncbi:hypothetical protein HYX05_04095 [Candidatus Woesearchaeota archaeon]|nr:hypothetical protein [Candidatus Woesearchaeota archaeon]
MKKITLIVAMLLSLIVLPNIAVSQQDYQVYIGKGWNIISYTDDILEHDFSSPYIAAYWFDPSEKRYYQIGPNNEFEEHIKKYSNEEKKLFRNHAMWIYSEKETTAEIDESDFAPLSEVKLFDGWNLLTVSPEMADVQIKDLPGNCEIEKVYFFNPESQQWFKVEIDDDFEPNQVGMGVAIKVKDECSFEKPKPTIAPPPEIPTG